MSYEAVVGCEELKRVDKMKHKKTRPKPKQASVESPYHPEVRILCRLDSKELRDLLKNLHKVRTPKALTKAINSYLDAIKAAETSYNRRLSRYEAQRVAIRIRTKILENNPGLDIPKVPITKDDALFAILDWCADVCSYLASNDVRAKKPAEREWDTTPAKDEKEKAAINVHISGDVQAESVQIGHDSSIQKQTVTGEKKRGGVKKLLKIIAAIVGFLAALFTCLGYLLGWLGPIKAFFTR